MCGPAIAALVPAMSSLAPIIAGVGAVTSAYGAIQQSRFQNANLKYSAKISDYNAQVAENNAITAANSAIADADTIERQRKIFLSQETAQRAAQGVVINEGSTLETLGDAAAEFELERLNRLHQGETQSRAHLAQAGQDRANSRGLLAQASQARTSGTIGALTSLASGGYRIARSMPGSVLTAQALPGNRKLR